MAVTELVSVPLFSLNNSSGFNAPRRWACDTWSEAMQLCRDIAANPFPLSSDDFAANNDCWATSITVGPFNESMAPGSTGGAVTELPTYEKYIVVAQYQLLNDVGDEQFGSWPQFIDKPSHPVGTTLTLRIRNSGQFITLPGDAGKVVNEAGTEVARLTTNFSLVKVIPIREFHITCDRMTDWQVPQFELYSGQVNESTFLGCDPETLLFETGECDHSFAADPEEPRRFRVTAVLRERHIDTGSAIVGWNHEYHNVGNDKGGPGWYRVKLSDGSDRYERVDMTDLLGS